MGQALGTAYSARLAVYRLRAASSIEREESLRTTRRVEPRVDSVAQRWQTNNCTDMRPAMLYQGRAS